MIIKGILDESFVDYKKPSMYIAFPNCSFKCDALNNAPVCQNCKLVEEPDIEIDKKKIIERYMSNPITQAIVLSGLEPFDNILDVISFVHCLRNDYKCEDDVVIYTGYSHKEMMEGRYGQTVGGEKVKADLWKSLTTYSNIYVKFGRFILGQEKHFDQVLGIQLASNNQYGEKVSQCGQ